MGGDKFYFILFLLEKKMRIGGKKREKREIIAVRKQRQTFGFFFFFLRKIKTFGNIYMNELNFFHTFLYTHPKSNSNHDLKS